MSSNAGLKWTKEEEMILEDMSSRTTSIRSMARRLKRSEGSILRKLERMNCSDRYMMIGTISVNMLSNCLGVEFRKISRHIERDGLPANRYSLSSRKVKRKNFHIKIEEFWKWAENFQDEFDWRKYERLSLLPEPEWLEEAILKSERIPRNSRRSWTTGEEELLWSLYYTDGKSQKDIAKKLERSVSSVQKKLKRLRSKKIG